MTRASDANTCNQWDMGHSILNIGRYTTTVFSYADDTSLDYLRKNPLKIPAPQMPKYASTFLTGCNATLKPDIN